jgi:hypothetical protein
VNSQRGTPHQICKHCEYLTKHNNLLNGKTPKNLNEHLERCDKYKVWRRTNPSGDYNDEHMNHSAKKNILDDYLMSPSDILPTRGAMTSTKLCEQVLRIIVAGNLSFSFAENPEFVALLRHAYPDCDIPNRRSVAKALKKAAKDERVALREELMKNDSKVSIALDAWTSSNTIAFLGMYIVSREERRSPSDLNIFP